MRIIRYLDFRGQERYGALCEDGSANELSGDLSSGLKSVNRPADVRKLLAPLVPSNIFGIGLNYRRHAEEASVKFPEYPVLFVKGLNTLQHPGDPIFIPTYWEATKSSTNVNWQWSSERSARTWGVRML